MKSQAVSVGAVWLVSLLGTYFFGVNVGSNSGRSPASANRDRGNSVEILSNGGERVANSHTSFSVSSMPESPQFAKSRVATLVEDDTADTARISSGGSSNSKLPNPYTGLAAVVFDALNISDQYGRKQAIHEALSGLDSENALIIAQVFEDMKAAGLPYGEEFSEFGYRWGELDGAAAMEFMARNDGPTWASRGAIEALRGWTEMDPGGARRWVDQLGSGEWNESVVRGYVQGLAGYDINEATEFAFSLRGKTDLAPIFSDIFDVVLSSGGLSQAQALFRNLPPGNHHIKRQLFDDITQSKLRIGTAEALQWVNENAHSVFRDDLAVQRVAAQLTHEDPVAALDWVMSLPPSPQSHDYTGIGDVIGNWDHRDLDNLGLILNERKGQRGYDQAAAQFAYRVNNVDDRAAWAWASTIQDESFRNVVYRRLNPNRAAR